MTIKRMNVRSGEAETIAEVAPSFKKDPTAADVKTEAERRIVTICPEWKQRNTLARALTHVKKVLLDGETLTKDELADVTAMEAMFGQIDAHRDASDRLEAGSIPEDFDDDKHWP